MRVAGLPFGHLDRPLLGQRLGNLPIVWHVRNSRQLRWGLATVCAVALAGVAAPWAAPYNPTNSTTAILHAPSLAHPFGTDQSGFDILSRTLYAPRVDILIAVSATLIAMIVGVPLGMVAGFRGGVVGELLLRAIDIIQSFEFFILAIVLLAVFGPSLVNIICVIAFVYTPIYIRLMRSEGARMRARTFVDAARLAGCTTTDIIFRHILRNSLAPALAQLSISVAGAIILTSGISFVGAGVGAPTPEWGVMIADGAPQMVTGQWWTVVFPGAALAITTAGYGLVANGIAELADPRRRHG
jgi:peptide/nickel transport system permease protein